jgi:hypothetical protein
MTNACGALNVDSSSNCCEDILGMCHCLIVLICENELPLKRVPLGYEFTNRSSQSKLCTSFGFKIRLERLREISRW